MVDLSVQYAGLELRNPIVIGSSGLTDSAKKNRAWEKAGCGAVVLSSLFEEQIDNESKRALKGEDYRDAYPLIRNYVKSNKIMDYLALIRDSKNECTIPIIASINCYTDGAWVEFTHHIENAGADALELNISAIVSNPLLHPIKTYEKYIGIVKSIKKAVNIPVIVKSSRLFNNVPWIVNQLKMSGADGVVLFNKLYQPDIDIDTLRVKSGGIYSSAGDLSDTLRWISLSSANVPGIDLAASTGVHGWEGVIKCLLAGASTVQMVSAIYQDKEKKIIPQITKQVTKWMKSKGFKSINQFKGMLHADPAIDTTVFERAQFMRYFKSFDES